MYLLDVHIAELGGSCRGQSPNEIRHKIFDGANVDKARLDFLFAEEAVWYGLTPIQHLHRDLIEETSKLLEDEDHEFQIDGYPFLNLMKSGEVYEVRLQREGGSWRTYLINPHHLSKEVVECIRVTENIIDALRYDRPEV